MKFFRAFMAVGVFAFLCLLWIGIQGTSCHDYQSAVEAYFLEPSEHQVDGVAAPVSTNQITVTMALPGSGLKVIIRDANGTLLAIGRSEP